MPLRRMDMDKAISQIVEHANRLNSPMSFVVLEFYGGAAGRVSNDATAYSHRDLPWDILFTAQWTDRAQNDMHRDWARGGEQMLRSFSQGGYLLSALDVEAEDVVKAAFGSNLPRLTAIKKKYDPTNFFRMNQNIKA